MCKTRSARYLPPSGPNFRLDLLFHQRLEKQKEEKKPHAPFDDISYNIIKKYNTGDPPCLPPQSCDTKTKEISCVPSFCLFVMGFMAIKKPNKNYYSSSTTDRRFQGKVFDKSCHTIPMIPPYGAPGSLVLG